MLSKEFECLNILSIFLCVCMCIYSFFYISYKEQGVLLSLPRIPYGEFSMSYKTKSIRQHGIHFWIIEGLFVYMTFNVICHTIFHNILHMHYSCSVYFWEHFIKYKCTCCLTIILLLYFVSINPSPSDMITIMKNSQKFLCL